RRCHPRSSPARVSIPIAVRAPRLVLDVAVPDHLQRVSLLSGRETPRPAASICHGDSRANRSSSGLRWLRVLGRSRERRGHASAALSRYCSPVLPGGTLLSRDRATNYAAREHCEDSVVSGSRGAPGSLEGGLTSPGA